METSVNLTFLDQLISAVDVIILELVKEFGSLASFVTVFDCLNVFVSFLWVFMVWVFYLRNVWVFVLRSLSLAVEIILLMP